MCGFFGTLNYWVEVSNYSTFDRDYNNTIYPRLSIANTFSNTNIFNAQSTFNNSSPISNTAPTLPAHLTTKSFTDATYQTIAGMTNYLTTIAASSTYQTIAGMSSYLTTSAASSTYQTIAGMTSYLTTSAASSTYQTIAGMTNYLTTSSASSTYQPLIVGSIIQMAAGVVPSGYLECNGASVDNNTYGALFNVIGYTYGGTYPSAIYSLPDFRGIFLRGKGVNGIDNTYASSTNYGFLQRDGLKAHNHGIDFGYSDNIQGGGSGGTRAYVSTSPNYNNPGPGTLRASGFTVNNSNPDPDTHPANYAVLFCIKY